ncbi:hypothetical protein N9X05_03665 [Paracoccaceae bacterium]|nr:hypothetical protein [Paracoccaceae bacterium]
MVHQEHRDPPADYIPSGAGADFFLKDAFLVIWFILIPMYIGLKNGEMNIGYTLFIMACTWVGSFSLAYILSLAEILWPHNAFIVIPAMACYYYYAIFKEN